VPLVLLFVPLGMQGRPMAREARRPRPLVAAPRTSSARGKRVPDRAAGIKRRLGSSTRVAAPEARGGRSPTAERTPDADRRLLVVLVVNAGDDGRAQGPVVFQQHDRIVPWRPHVTARAVTMSAHGRNPGARQRWHRARQASIVRHGSRLVPLAIRISVPSPLGRRASRGHPP
jgi:hypothetical protein